MSRDDVLDGAPLQTFEAPLWRTNDGLYESSELLQAPYIEIVNPQGVKAIRIWFNEGDRFKTSYDFIDPIHSTEGYFQCYDESGADFGPTGQIGTPGATPEPALQDLVISGYSNDLYDADEVVNLETGERVQLTKANWNYNNDIAGRHIQCDERGYDTSCNNGGTYSTGCGFAASDPDYYMMPWHLTDSTANHGANLFWWRSFQGVRNNSQLSIEAGLVAPQILPGNAPSIDRVIAPIFLRSDLVELVDDDKVRVWHEPTDSGFSRYYECNVRPTGIADSEATTTDTTNNTSDESNNQTEGSGDQTDSGSSDQTAGNNNQNDDSLTLSDNTQSNNEASTNSGGGSIDTWCLFLLLGLLRLNISNIRRVTKKKNRS